MRSSVRYFGITATSIILCSFVLTGQASAQVDTPALPDGEISDIVVTAQKKNENLRDVPTSVSVITGEDLAKIHATSIADYASYVPGLSISSNGAPGKDTVTIRGISTGGQNTGPLVGTYIDDVPVGATGHAGRPGAFSIDLFPDDLDQLEVLRGPQGTFYGASTMGGLLKYTLKKADPDHLFAVAGTNADFTASTSRPTYAVHGAVNIPLVTDVLGIRVSGFYQNSAGWIDNIGINKKNTNKSTPAGGRASVLWHPSSQITAIASVLVQNINTDAGAAITLNSATLNPVYGQYTNKSALLDPSSSRLQDYALTINWNSPFAKLTSATSYSVSKNQSVADDSAIFVPLFQLFSSSAPANGLVPFFFGARTKKFTQELRASSIIKDQLDWAAGVFYTDEDILVNEHVNALTLTGTAIAGVDPLADVYWPNKYREIAGFGNLTYHLSDKLSLGGGVRYSQNYQSFHQTQVGGLYAPGINIHNGSSSEGVATWSVTTLYRLDSTNNIYGRIATGYRPGGANTALGGAPGSFKSDTLTNYEGGYKGKLLNGRLVLDISGFYINWKNIQLQLLTPLRTSYLGNASEAKNSGVEADSQFLLTPGLTVGATFSYTDARLGKDAPSIKGKQGDQLPESPHYTTSARIDYSTRLENFGLAAGLAYRYRDVIFNTVASDTTRQKVPAQNIVDAYAQIAAGRYTLKLYVKNLLNDYNISDVYFPGNFGVSQYSVGLPRTIGVGADAKF